MKFFPYENYHIKSKLSSEIVIEKLIENIEEKSSRSYNENGIPIYEKPYRGRIKDHKFLISRNIAYRNGSKPRIRGKIISKDCFTDISITMALHPLITVYMFVMTSPFLLVFIVSLMEMIDKRSINYVPFLLFGVLILIYSMIYFPFKYESSKSKEFLSKLFEAE